MTAVYTETPTRPDYIDHDHWEEFLASAIKPSIIDKNFRSIHDSREVDRLLNRNAKRRTKHSDHLVPCWSVTGLDPLGWERTEDGVQIKPDTPEVDEKGKAQKYLGATGYDAAPLFLETDDIDYWDKVRRDLTIPLLITEGAKKAAAGLSIDRATVSVPGVSTCRKLGRLHRHLEVFCKFGRTTYLCFDNDTMQKKQVQHALLSLARDVAAKGAKVMVVMLPPGEAKGMDDYIAMHGKEAFNKLVENALTIEEWRKQLEAQWQRETAEKGDDQETIDPLLAKYVYQNKVHKAATKIIKEACNDSIRYNELTMAIEVEEEPVNLELIHLNVAAKSQVMLPLKMVTEIVNYHAKSNSYHPVKEYLNEVSLIHSNTEILDNLSTKLFGTTHPLHDIMFRKWLIAGVARIMQPGCKADDILILHGGQGINKSTVFETLGGEDWFCDSCEGVGNDKDSLLQMHSSWIIELAEIDRFLNKKDASDLKKTVSIRRDKFRAPYGRNVEEFPRRFILAGSTNRDEFLTDPTGNRRYWVLPVAVAQIDIEWLRQHRDEIWSAAVHLYNAGHKWYLNSEEKAEHAKLMKPFEVSDSWGDYIQSYLDNGSYNQTTVSDLMTNCLKLEIHLQTKATQMRVADILRAMGWIRTNCEMNGSKKSWKRPIVSTPNVNFENFKVDCEVEGKVEDKVEGNLNISTTPTNTKLQDITSTTPSTSSTFSEKTDSKIEVINNNLDPEKKENSHQIKVEVEGINIPKNETQVNQDFQASPPPPPKNEAVLSTSQESSIEEKTEDLRAALEAGATTEAVETLMGGWELRERKQVELLLNESQKQQLRDLVG
jgi:predicted P-loop ATPase